MGSSNCIDTFQEGIPCPVGNTVQRRRASLLKGVRGQGNERNPTFFQLIVGSLEEGSFKRNLSWPQEGKCMPQVGGRGQEIPQKNDTSLLDLKEEAVHWEVENGSPRL